MFRRQAEFAKAESAYQVQKLQQQWAAEDEAVLQAADWRTVEIRRLGAEVDQLRQQVADLERALRPDGKMMSPFLDVIGKTVGEQARRIDALEQRPSMQYRGTYDPVAQYTPGSIVTDHGSAWHCNSACTGQRPPGPSWALMVKSGRDGRDGKAAPAVKGVVA